MLTQTKAPNDITMSIAKGLECENLEVATLKSTMQTMEHSHLWKPTKRYQALHSNSCVVTSDATSDCEKISQKTITKIIKQEVGVAHVIPFTPLN